MRAIFRSARGTGAIVALVVAVAALAYWGHAAYQKRQLQRAAAQLVAEATQQADAALSWPSADADSVRRLEDARSRADAAVQKLAALEGWRDPRLATAAQRYLDEVQALLRRTLAAASAAGALRADIETLTLHLRGAQRRSSAWIGEAIAKKRDMERRFFDYRLAAGGLQKSFDALPQARAQIAAVPVAVPLVDPRRIAQARGELTAATEKLQRDVEAARTLPEAR